MPIPKRLNELAKSLAHKAFQSVPETSSDAVTRRYYEIEAEYELQIAKKYLAKIFVRLGKQVDIEPLLKAILQYEGLLRVIASKKRLSSDFSKEEAELGAVAEQLQKLEQQFNESLGMPNLNFVERFQQLLDAAPDSILGPLYSLELIQYLNASFHASVTEVDQKSVLNTVEKEFQDLLFADMLQKQRSVTHTANQRLQESVTTNPQSTPVITTLPLPTRSKPAATSASVSEPKPMPATANVSKSVSIPKLVSKQSTPERKYFEVSSAAKPKPTVSTEVSSAPKKTATFGDFLKGIMSYLFTNKTKISPETIKPNKTAPETNSVIKKTSSFGSVLKTLANTLFSTTKATPKTVKAKTPSEPLPVITANPDNKLDSLVEMPRRHNPEVNPAPAGKRLVL